jgi:HK97 family phage prohead protease
MTIQYKTVASEFKASGDKGVYEGHFSVFGNVDDGGDVIMAGAFARTIAERASRIKVFYAHDWMKLIGPPPDVLQEDSTGLYAKGRLTLGSFWGNEAWQLMKDGALTEGSIGYEPEPGTMTYDDRGVRFLKELKLYEISPVPLGMNPLTEVQAIKRLGQGNDAAYTEALLSLLASLKAGARHSNKDQQMIQQIHDTVAELGAACADTGKALPLIRRAYATAQRGTKAAGLLDATNAFASVLEALSDLMELFDPAYDPAAEAAEDDMGKGKRPTASPVAPSALARAAQMRAASRALAQLQQLARSKR